MTTAPSESAPKPPRANLFRRGLGISICFAPAVLLLASIAFWDGESSINFLSLALAAIGLLLGILNFYLSLVRPWLYRRRNGSMAGYRFDSGLPMIGTLFIVVAGMVGFGEALTALIGLAALALDTGGAPWFLIATWHDRGFWDARDR